MTLYHLWIQVSLDRIPCLSLLTIVARMVKYFTYNTNQWVGYDDPDTFALKESMANSYCIGGTMVWSVDFGVSEG
jgi:hypothetical protein